MIGVIVTIGPGTDRERASAAAEKTAPMFEGMEGLRSKVYMWDEETRTVTNTYVWDSESAARAFFTPGLKAEVLGLWGAEPQVRFAEGAGRAVASARQAGSSLVKHSRSR